MHEHIRRHALPLAVGLTVALTAAGAAGAVQHEPWQQATPVTAVNGPSTEGCPIESPDGNHLFIMSERGAGATRTSGSHPATTPTSRSARRRSCPRR